MSDEKLKPCPFCGGPAFLWDLKPTYKEYYIQCQKCRIEQKLYKSRAAAINAWNRRKNV